MRFLENSRPGPPLCIHNQRLLPIRASVCVGPGVVWLEHTIPPEAALRSHSCSSLHALILASLPSLVPCPPLGV